MKWDAQFEAAFWISRKPVGYYDLSTEDKSEMLIYDNLVYLNTFPALL